MTHKIKLKIKENRNESIIRNLHILNFHFERVLEKENNISITFYSQYQIERFLNITNLEKYNIQTFVENFPKEEENHYKVCFIFSFHANDIDFINNKLENYLKPKNNS